MKDQPAPDPTMIRIGEAVQLGRSGQKVHARTALTALWDEIGAGGDAFHRCALAHYLADLQDTLDAELRWDERALAAVSDLTDDRAQRYLASLQVQAFLPSLHLNLADCHRRLGNAAQARKHLAEARQYLTHLPDDAYGEAIRAAVRDFDADDPTGSRP